MLRGFVALTVAAAAVAIAIGQGNVWSTTVSSSGSWSGFDFTLTNTIPVWMGNGWTNDIGISADPEVARTNVFTSDMSAEYIQSNIQAQARWAAQGHNVYFDFGAGTFYLDEQLYFSSLVNGGGIWIRGVDATTNKASGLSTSQGTTLCFTNSSDNACIYVRKCTSPVYIQQLKIQVPDLNVNGIWVQFGEWCDIDSCLLQDIADGASVTKGVYFSNGARGRLMNTYFDGVRRCLTSALHGKVHSKNNDDTGTLPDTGLRCEGGGVISKEGTQPTATTGEDPGTATGGIIRP